jgi:3-hydroxy-9,10-secoandrosta-1,3,5(10)-triene-9,17-dione monooxygenase
MLQRNQETHEAIKESCIPMVERAKAVAIRLAQRAQAADQERELPPETLRDLHDRGLLTMSIPRAYGGTEVDLLTQMVVYEIIGGACASTAWCLGNHISMCTRLMGMLGEQSRPYIQSVVEEGAVIAHGAVPTGTTLPVPGGFVSTGRWPFVSGSNQAGWLFLSTLEGVSKVIDLY